MGLHSNNTDKKKTVIIIINYNNNKFIRLLKYFRENNIRKKGSLPRTLNVLGKDLYLFYSVTLHLSLTTAKRD